MQVCAYYMQKSESVHFLPFPWYIAVTKCMWDDFTHSMSLVVEPLKSGHFGGRAQVHCREVVPISEVG